MRELGGAELRPNKHHVLPALVPDPARNAALEELDARARGGGNRQRGHAQDGLRRDRGGLARLVDRVRVPEEELLLLPGDLVQVVAAVDGDAVGAVGDRRPALVHQLPERYSEQLPVVLLFG